LGTENFADLLKDLMGILVKQPIVSTGRDFVSLNELLNLGVVPIVHALVPCKSNIKTTLICFGTIDFDKDHVVFFGDKFGILTFMFEKVYKYIF
jgi:hypothetical protein